MIDVDRLVEREKVLANGRKPLRFQSRQIRNSIGAEPPIQQIDNPDKFKFTTPDKYQALCFPKAATIDGTMQSSSVLVPRKCRVRFALIRTLR